MTVSQLSVRARLAASVRTPVGALLARARRALAGAPTPFQQLRCEPLEQRLLFSTLTATATAAGTILLNWANDFGGSAPIRVERSTDGTHFTDLATVNAQDLSYRDTSVSHGVTYSYRVDTPATGTPADTSDVAAATAGPTGNQWVLLDTVPIPVDGSPVWSSVSLTAGDNYQLRASGDYYLGGATGRADAQYSYSPTSGYYNAYDWGFQYGIGVNDTSTGSAKYPFWGPYNPAHNYSADIVGEGSALSFTNHDDNYVDNVADDAQNPFQMEIWQHLPAAPTALVATADPSGSVHLSWLNNATDQTGFGIERSDDGGATFNKIGDVDAATADYTDAGLSIGQTYYYRVSADNDAGQSDYSNIASTAPTSTASVSGHVYQTSLQGLQQGPLASEILYVDTNGNGKRDVNEPYGTTAANGSYSILVPIAPGETPTYSLQPDLSAGVAAELTSPAAGNYSLTLSAGDIVSNEDFGLYLDQSPSFDSTPPQNVQVNPYAPAVPLNDSAWKRGELFLASDQGSGPNGIQRVNPDGTPVNDPAPGGAAAAEFIGEDTQTSGTWSTTYGSDGYALFGTPYVSVPAYAQLAVSGATSVQYPDHDGDATAMQTSADTDARSAAGYAAATSFSLDLNVTDTKAHQVALYLTDYNQIGAQESVNVSDADSGASLFSKALPTASTGLYLGSYLVWNVSGHIRITVTSTMPGVDCLATGLMFDPVKARYLTYDGFNLPTGMAFDTKDNLFATDFLGTPAKFNADGTFGSFVQATKPFSGDESIVFDGVGDMYIGNVRLISAFGSWVHAGGAGIYKFNPQGQLVDVLALDQNPNQIIDWMDLAADQHTLVFDTEGGTIYSLDTNTGQMNAPFAVLNPDEQDGGPGGHYAYAMRFIPGGGTSVVGDDGQPHTAAMLVADSAHVLALDGQGHVIKTYDAVDPEDADHGLVDGWFALNLDPDGTSFWSSNNGGDAGGNGHSVVTRFDIRTGQVLETFVEPSTIAGVAVFGERTAAESSPETPVTYAAHAISPNGHALTYSLLNPTNGASVDPATGLLSWTPPGPGTYSFTLVAADTQFPQLQGTQTFSVVVSDTVPGNQNPIFQTAPVLSAATVGRQYVNQITATDPDGDRLTYSLSGPSGFTINADTGTISWTATAQAQADGHVTFTANVSDPRGGQAERTFTIPVLPPDGAGGPVSLQVVNDIPVATAGQHLSFDVHASGVGTITVAPVSLPPGMSFLPAYQGGTLDWTPSFGQAGIHNVLLSATDTHGDTIQKSFSVLVQNGTLSIDHVQVDPVDDTSMRLTVVPSDPAMLKGATFHWSVTSNGLPSPQVQQQNGLTNDSHAVTVVFGAAGTYQFTVTGTNSQGNSLPVTQTITVAQAPARIVAAPAAVAAVGGQAVALAAVVYDQFGSRMVAQPPLTWAFVNNASGGTLDAATGAYVAGSTGGTDGVQVSTPLGSGTVSADVAILVAAGTAIVGSAASDLAVTEGQAASYDGTQGNYGYLATFYDPQSGTSASDYTATINWGDGNDSSSGVVSPSTDPNVPTSLRPHMFNVSASHIFGQEGHYLFTVHLSGPGGRHATATPRPGHGISVASAPVYAQPFAIKPMATRLYSGPVAEFIDTSPTSSPSEFSVTIHWGDGTSSQGTIAPVDPGLYEVDGSHRYGSDGTPINATADVYEIDDGPAVLRASTKLNLTVLPASLNPPTGVTAVAISDSQVEVQWDRDPAVPAYLLVRVNPDGTRLALPFLLSMGPFFDEDQPGHAVLPATQYGYQVIAVDSFNNYSDPSPTVYAQTWGPAAAPTLSASLDAGGAVHLSWTDNRGSDLTITGWDVLRAPASDPTDFTSLISGDEVTAPEYDDTTVAAQRSYVYEVVALQHVTERGAPSNAVTITTAAAPSEPQPPSNLQTGLAGFYNDQWRVGLKWDAPAGTSLLGYDVYRGTTPQFVTDATTLVGSSSDTGYTDDLKVAGTYYYVVKAVAALADGTETSSAGSNTAGVNTASATVAPTAPSNLSAPDALLSTGVPADHVKLTWTDNSINEAGFEIRRKPDGASDSQYQVVGRSTQDDNQFTDAWVSPATSYDYEVYAYNFGPGSSAVESGAAGPLRVTTANPGNAPAAPANLAVNVGLTTYRTIALTWDAPTPNDNLTGYFVYRQQSDGSWLRLTTDPLTSAGYTDDNLEQGSYTYRVTAVSADLAQSQPLQGTFTTPAAPDLRPSVQITAPATFNGINVDFNSDLQSDGRLQKLTQVRAIVEDPNGDLVSWSLVLRPTGLGAGVRAADIPLASGTSSIGSIADPSGAVVYTLDPTLFANGNYQLILTATDSHGPTDQPAVVDVSLYSQTKLGNLTLPVTDLQFTSPGGQTITVRRVYDSQKADVLGDFGYGWSLDLSDTSIRTTAEKVSDYGGNAFRPGDIVYITLPGGQQHAFQFWPVPTNFSPTLLNPYDPTYDTYWIQFVCVDGSNATLTVPGDIHDPVATDRPTIEYDRGNNVFVGGGMSGSAGQIAYDPAADDWGGQYQVTTAEGNSYLLSASTGNLLWTQDANGNVTRYGADTVTTGGMSLHISRQDDSGLIESIELLDSQGAPLGQVSYSYTDAQGRATTELTSVQNLQSVDTFYEYDTAPGFEHYLTRVSSSGGNDPPVTTLIASWDPLGRLSSLTDAYGRNAQVGIGSSDGRSGSQLASNLVDPANPPTTPAGTETVYDNQGNVARTIQKLTDASGNLTGYSVTVHEYSYFSGGIGDELFEVFDPTPGYQKQAGSSSQNSLASTTDYAPFVISGADSAGLRYSQDPTELRKEVDFYQAGELDSSNAGSLRLPSTETDYLGDGSTRVTSYSKYVDGKPGNVTVTVSRGTSSKIVSSTDSYYDADGNLIYSFDALGQGTMYVYTDGTGGLPKGLLLQTWRVTGESSLSDNDPNTNPTKLDPAPQTQNAYYTSSDAAPGMPGAAYAKLKSSIDASGQLTWYTYDALENSVNTYKLWKNPQAGQGDRWTGTTNVYDGSSGRVIATYQGEYLDSGTPGVLDLSAASQNAGEGFIAEPLYTGFNNGQPLQASATRYDGLGRVGSSTDAYGATTNYTYDAVGNQVQTINADLTQTLSVFDPMGRVVWQTDPFFPGGPSPVLATHTVYDASGRVVSTERYQGTNIQFTSNPNWPVQTTQLVSAGTLISSTHTYYDAQGRTVESDDASTLRTGTVYYPDGQVQYTGPLTASAAVGGGSSGTFSTGDFASYTTSLYNQFDTSTGKPFSGLLYNRTIDPDGHHTDTYQDALGRTTFTVSDDGTYTQMLYGVGKSPVAGHVVSGQTIDGYQTTTIDPLGQATDSFYDPSGRLTDVYQPAVIDADPASSTHNQSVRPHWHYAYDQAGNELSQTDPRGDTTTFTYDERGNKLSRTLPGNQSESWTYDQYNRVLTHRNMNGQTAWEVYANAPQWNQQGFDPGRLIAEYRYTGSFTPPVAGTSPDSTNWSERTVYVYDDGTTDPSTGYILPGPEQTHLGRVSEIQEWTRSGSTRTQSDFTHTTYDPVTGQPSSISSNEGTINYTYDPVTGQKVRMYTGTDPANAPDDTAYGYDSQGRLTQVYTLVLDGTRHATFTGVNSTTHDPTFTGTPLTVSYSYDAAGNLKTESQPDDTTTTNTYDDLNRLTDLNTENTATNKPVFAEHYDLRADGLRQDVIDTRYNTDGSVFSQTKVNWTYDGVDRLTSEALVVLAGESNAPAAYSDVFKFDLSSNRTEEGISGSANATVTYTYNSDNELGTETRTGDAAYGITYSYDNAGNLIGQVRTGTDAETDSYTWDLRGRMASATVSGTTTTYSYDSNGVRTSESTGSTHTYYLNDPTNPTGYTKAVEESSTKGGSPYRSYVLGLQVEGQSDSTNGPLFLLHDGHGSTRALINPSGMTVEQYNYDAFGTLLASTGAQSDAASALTPWLFGGDGLYDPGSGWTYQLARYRNGFRFASVDPTVFVPGLLANANLYVYVGGNPINLRDPSGHMSIPELLVSFGIALTVTDLLYHSYSAINHIAHGQTNAAYQDEAWAAIDLLSFGVPIGPAAEMAGEVASMARVIPFAAVWGYIDTLFSVGSAVGGGSGSSSSGGGSSSGGSTNSGPGQWEPEDQSSWSESARKYQEQITGRSGQAYRLNGVKFDGFDGTNLLDAKDYYSWALDESGNWQPWFDPQAWVKLARRQVTAAAGHPIVWHFAEEEVADAVRPLVQGEGVQVVYTQPTP